MKESNNITNRFSDAYIVALLEGKSVEDVVFHYEQAYPELGETLRRNAKNLELLYGHIRMGELPSESEVAAAYGKLKLLSRISPSSATPSETFFSRFSKSLSSVFQARPAVAGASLGIGLAVLLAVIWQPWKQIESQPSANNQKQIIAPSDITNGPGEIAEAPGNTKTPLGEEGPIFRGSEINKQDNGQLDKKDRTRLSKMPVDISLTAPTGLKVIGASDSVVVVSWNAVKNALSYIVEIKRANEGEFKAVSQTNQTQARISGLPSSERMEIRVTAASGERKGEASAAKNITVP
jgi:hypothetical protein